MAWIDTRRVIALVKNVCLSRILVLPGVDDSVRSVDLAADRHMSVAVGVLVPRPQPASIRTVFVNFFPESLFSIDILGLGTCFNSVFAKPFADSFWIASQLGTHFPQRQPMLSI